jgi:hypothetical protein
LRHAQGGDPDSQAQATQQAIIDWLFQTNVTHGASLELTNKGRRLTNRQMPH